MLAVQRLQSAILVVVAIVVVAASAQHVSSAPKQSGTNLEVVKKENPGARASCGGKDMLTEMARTDPVRYRQIKLAAENTENTEAIFWRVARPGSAPSYLFGTIHLTDPRVTKISPSVKQALQTATTLALEVADPSPVAMARALTGALQLAIYSEGTSLKTLLSAEDYAKVERKLKTAGMPAKLAQVFRPWVITMLLSSSECERRRAARGTRVLDMELAAIAKTHNVPIVGLETINDQMQALSSVPNADQLAMLKAGLPYMERSNDLIETLVQIYINRNIGATWPFQVALAEKAGVSAASFDSFRTGLIVQRNRNMRDKAIPLIEKGGTFIAVGALHLTGKDGLVALLRKAGFKISPLE